MRFLELSQFCDTSHNRVEVERRFISRFVNLCFRMLSTRIVVATRRNEALLLKRQMKRKILKVQLLFINLLTLLFAKLRVKASEDGINRI